MSGNVPPPPPPAPAPAPVPAPAAPPPPPVAPVVAPPAPPAPEPPKAAESLTIDTNLLGDQPKAPETPEPPKEATPIDPASYEIKLPEGFDPADPMVATFRETAAKAGLQGDAVQAVIDSMAPKMRDIAQAPYKAFKELQTDWQRQIQTNPNFGGDKLPGTVASINHAFGRIGDETFVAGLRQALITTGGGNNPFIFEAFAKLSAPFAEGGPVTGNPAPQKGSEKSPAQVMYGGTQPA